MENKFKNYQDKLRFFIGDVRDEARLKRALNGIDYVIHAAAMKQVPACEYNPIEAIKTNIDGATSVINASLDSDVTRVVALDVYKRQALCLVSSIYKESRHNAMKVKIKGSLDDHECYEF